jgi:non-ribosomal peptide synthetase component F
MGTGKGWHTVREDGRLTVARQWPPRFDVAAEDCFPPVRMGRLAHRLRRDLWRLLRDLRGFSPVIEITRTATGVAVRAGGRALPPVPRDTERRIAALLACPAHRGRWLVRADGRTG